MIEKDVAMVLQDKLRKEALTLIDATETVFDSVDEEIIKAAARVEGIMEMLRFAITLIEEETK